MAQGGQTVFLIRDYLFTRLDKQAQDFVEKPKATAVPGTPKVSAADEAGDEAAEEGPADADQGGDPPGAEQD
jgi:hypothetical protein